jgi:hypothetical protein
MAWITRLTNLILLRWSRLRVRAESLTMANDVILEALNAHPLIYADWFDCSELESSE